MSRAGLTRRRRRSKLPSYMSPIFIVSQNLARNGINGQVHHVINGPYTSEDARIIEKFGPGYVKTVEAKSLAEAQKLEECPACEAAIHFREH